MAGQNRAQRKHAQTEKIKAGALVFLFGLSPVLGQMVTNKQMELAIVPFISSVELEKLKVWSKRGNKGPMVSQENWHETGYVRKDLFFSSATVCVSFVDGKFCVEVVYIPKPKELREDFHFCFETLARIYQFRTKEEGQSREGEGWCSLTQFFKLPHNFCSQVGCTCMV